MTNLKSAKISLIKMTSNASLDDKVGGFWFIRIPQDVAKDPQYIVAVARFKEMYSEAYAKVKLEKLKKSVQQYENNSKI